LNAWMAGSSPARTWEPQRKNSLNNSCRYKRQAESWHKSKFVVFIRNVGSKIALSCGRRRTSVQSRFLQPGARVAQSGKRSQGFFYSNRL
jgi:hypothetical protein